jgi:glutamine amidotransferase
MLRKLGFDSLISSNPDELDKAEKLILPGVGAFDRGIGNLEELHLIDFIKTRVASGIPILGICLGFQLLSHGSEEGTRPGLSLIDASTHKLRFSDTSRRIPHMGWNRIVKKTDSCLFRELADDPLFYFVHSYFVKCHDISMVVAETYYGESFTSVIEKGNIYGVQFHPEKSHRYGMQVLKNFASL